MDELYYKKKYQKYKMKYILYSEMNPNKKLEGGHDVFPSFNNSINSDQKNDLIKLVQEDGMKLKGISTELSNCEDIVLAAVKQNGMALEFASETLKDNYDIVLAAVERGNPLQLSPLLYKQTDLIFLQASKKLQNNITIINKLLKINILFMKLIPEPESDEDKNKITTKINELINELINAEKSERSEYSDPYVIEEEIIYNDKINTLRNNISTALPEWLSEEKKKNIVAHILLLN